GRAVFSEINSPIETPNDCERAVTAEGSHVHEKAESRRDGDHGGLSPGDELANAAFASTGDHGFEKSVAQPLALPGLDDFEAQFGRAGFGIEETAAHAQKPGLALRVFRLRDETRVLRGVEPAELGEEVGD